MELHERVGNKHITFMCYMGEERSRAIQEVFEAKGVSVDRFSGGTKRLCSMDIKSIQRELGNNFVYLIYDPSSKGPEFVAKLKATELLDRSGVEYRIIDTPYLQITANNLGKNFDEYLV